MIICKTLNNHIQESLNLLFPEEGAEAQGREDMAGSGFEPRADQHWSRGSRGVRSQVLVFRSVHGGSRTYGHDTDEEEVLRTVRGQLVLASCQHIEGESKDSISANV